MRVLKKKEDTGTICLFKPKNNKYKLFNEKIDEIYLLVWIEYGSMKKMLIQSLILVGIGCIAHPWWFTCEKGWRFKVNEKKF